MARAHHSVLAGRSSRPFAPSSRTPCRSARRDAPIPARLHRRMRSRSRWRASRPSPMCKPARSARAPCPPDTRVVAERFFDESRRHAADAPCSLRRTHQSRLGTGPAQTLLPHLQLRTAGRRHRQRHRHLAQRAALLPARNRLRVPAARYGRRCARAGAAGRAHVHRALALECQPRARHPALSRRTQSAAAHPAHARRRSDGRRLPRPGRLPRKPHRRGAHSRPSAGEGDHRQLPARGYGPRRPARIARSDSRRQHPHASPSTRRSPRRSRTRSSTPTLTPFWTTLRSKSAAPARCSCAAPCPPTLRKAPARSTRPPSRRSLPKPGRHARRR